MQMSSWQKTLSNILLTDPVFLIRRKKFNLYVLLKATILSSIMLVQFETPCCYNLIWLFSYKAEVPSPVEAFQLRNEYIIIVVYLISGLSIIIGGFLQNQSGFFITTCITESLESQARSKCSDTVSSFHCKQWLHAWL